MGQESEHLGLIDTAGRSFRSALVVGSALTLVLLAIDFGATPASAPARVPDSLVSVERVPLAPQAPQPPNSVAPPDEPPSWTPPVWKIPPRTRRSDGSDVPTRNPEIRPVLLKSVPPKYTEEARRARVSGIVVVEVVVGSDGKITQGHVLKALPFGLTQSAIDALREYRFQPGEVGGRPVATIMLLAIPFHWPPENK